MRGFEDWLYLLKLEQFWGTEAAGILAFAKKDKEFLISLRSPHVNEPNTYGIIGGKLDGSETPIAGAKREFLEETGYHGQMQLSVLKEFHATNFTYTNFLGIIPMKFNPSPDENSRWETSGFNWVSLDQLIQTEPKHFGLQYLLHDSAILEKLRNLTTTEI